MKISKRKLAAIYRKAAKRLEHYSWVQGSYESMGGYCAIGAFRAESVMAGFGLGEGYRLHKVEQAVAESVAKKAGIDLSTSGFGPAAGLIRLNDSKGATRELVISALRKVARALEHGGKV